MTLDRKQQWPICFAFLHLIIYSMGVPVDSDSSLIVSSTTVATDESSKEGSSTTRTQSMQIYQMQITSQVSNRFAHTMVLSRVKNYANNSQEATFSIVLPETAFISGFVMEIDGANYTAFVKEKEEAKKDYDKAIASGQSAAHVAVNPRDSNRFTVSVNVEPEKKAAFYLKYEELLKRQDNRYELVINIHPGQPVKDLSVKVTINESRKVLSLKVPPLRTGNEIGKEDPELDPRADVRMIDDKNAVVIFNPSLERQKDLAGKLETKVENGLAGQFVVQYDVERDPQGGDVLIQDGYFVHFFAPAELAPLPKHVVFILDTSGSMHGQKIAQLLESMVKILEQLNRQDVFQLVEFNSGVQVLDIDDPTKHVKYPDQQRYGYKKNDMYPPLSNIEFKPPYPATLENVAKAKSAVLILEATGSTDIYTSLEVGLHLIELAKASNSTHQPLVIFLTDGSPNVRIRSTDDITTKISEFNSNKINAAIFTLAFGNNANKYFMQKLAARNHGFSRPIYEAADASLQLQHFYKQISSPLLANVTFKYEPSTTSLTSTEFPLHFEGSELVVAGRYSTPEFVPPTVEGLGKIGTVTMTPTVRRNVADIERVWVHITIKQLLERSEISDKDADGLKKKALDLALKYQIVTPVSSLVVVKPNATSAVETEAADKIKGRTSHRGRSRSRSKSKLDVGISIADLSSLDDTTSVTTESQLAQRLSGPVWDALLRDTKPRVFTILPWLNNIVINDTISTSKGTYRLGLNETISDMVDCPKTPLNGTGYCALLHSCTKVYSLLSNKEVFEEHLCVLQNKYAGICCTN